MSPTVKKDEFQIYAVICGSFRRHLAQIVKLKTLLEEKGIGILSPAGSVGVNHGEEFIVLDSDPIDHHKLLQDSVFAKIRRSTFIITANFDGYLGKAALMEFGLQSLKAFRFTRLSRLQIPI